MQERTEAEILARAPIKAQLGGKEYEIPVLTILKARKWREQFVEAVQEVGGVLQEETKGYDAAFVNGLMAGFLRFPDKLAELIFSYAPSLNREEIEENATEEELARAFAKIMVVAFPFARQLATMTQIVNTAASMSRQPKYTN